MKKPYVTDDSGARKEYESGMVRDTQEGKPDYSLIYMPLLHRWAELMTRGAEKYGRNNWQLSNSMEELERFIASCFRHFIQWINNVQVLCGVLPPEMMKTPQEDHLAAVLFNAGAIERLVEKLGLEKEFNEKIQEEWRARITEGYFSACTSPEPKYNSVHGYNGYIRMTKRRKQNDD